ncbi:DUF5106 domain-containing protein [Bacteroides reticulotermitis]|uniref:DUF5106 domain-containing protein n=1 Tax=Bacteroides reticulotermitis TaxID=1133319 RepID=UPI003A869AF5
MKKNIKLLLPAYFVLLCACNSGSASNQSTNATSSDTITTFILPSIPPMYTTPEQRADFLIKHYWDHINFADTNYIHHPEVTEQGWANYCDILNHVPLTTAQEAIRGVMDKANVERKVFDHLADLADKYLYDPNSPMRNEEFYIPVLEAMIASPLLNETDKIRPIARLKLAEKNRIGTKALDFTYTLASGAQNSLYHIKSRYTLLFISNPGCQACGETIAKLKSMPVINQLIANKSLTILSIYPDEELDEWKKHYNDFPTEWINAYDKKLAIKEQQLYDLKAIPTLYLLDKDKKVLLKDAPEQAVEEYLLIH